MRWFMIFCTLVLLSGMAFSQTTVIGGYAGNWAPSYGVYAAPFVPLVTTPSVSLGTYSPSPAGASNATAGLTAGATNSTLSLITVPPQAVLTVPVWYGPTAAAPATPEHEAVPEYFSGRHHEHPYEIGSAMFQDNQGVARLAGLSRPQGKAQRTYTNDDANRMNQNNGMVKWDGKSETIQ